MTLAFVLAHWRSLGSACVLAVLLTALKWQNVAASAKHDRDVKRATIVADSLGRHAVRDSMANATRQQLDSLHGVIAERETAYTDARAETDRALVIAERKAASHAATDAVYAAQHALSDSAKADVTVQALSRASTSVVAENDTLKHTIGVVRVALTQERTRGDSLTQSYTQSTKALSGVLVGTSDALAVERAKPKRTKKGTLFAYTLGAATTAAVWVVPKFVAHFAHAQPKAAALTSIAVRQP